MKDLLGLDFEITDDKIYFQDSAQAKFSYNQFAIGDELFFQSTELLFETDIKAQNINVFEWHNLKVFYKTIELSALPFDVFAASFYLVSRYEEYLKYNPDKHGRFTATDSTAYKNNFLQQPLVNHFALELKKLLANNFPQLVFNETKFHFISTIDIDNAYAYKGKGLYRTAGAFARSSLKFDFTDLRLRFNTLSGKKPDPFDTYQYYFELQKQNQFKTIFFFLMGDFTAHDKNLPHTSATFQALIKSVAAIHEVGIHPSYSSNKKPTQLAIEIERLNKITTKKTTKSRQHFLKMEMPYTYQKLISAGITEDYTMGYADQVGFRASICNSFYFFDLSKNEITNLKLLPFAVMDATLNNYMKLSPDEAIKVSKKLIDEVKSVNGTFISLWHNETLSETGIWNGWRKVFEAIIQLSNTNG